jgi:2-desacetyl-2-hydroxyethyl bacteriochlorophyllide A dehydrogenase
MPPEGGALRELWFVEPRAIELRAGVRAPLTAGAVRARARFSGVSAGTELLLYKGEGPTPFDPSLGGADGRDGHAPTYPRRYGYAWVGEVVEVGEGAEHAIGTPVFALAPHGDEHVLARGAARALDADVPVARAVLAANLETAITCVWDSELGLGDDVIVIGAGVVGCLVALLAARTARRVRIVEPNAARAGVARQMGLEIGEAKDTPDGSADVVFEATGDPRALDDAIAWSRFEARIVVASFYGARTAPVALGDAFHRRRLTLRASQVSAIPPSRAHRWDHTRRFDLVRALLREPLLDALLAPAVPLSEAANLYAALAGSPPAQPQAVFSYP